jgi:hypothetical protein
MNQFKKIMNIQETGREFNLLHTSDSGKVYVNNLRKIRNSNNHHFNYEILTEMRDGTFPQDDDLYDVLPAVRDLLQFDEGYRAFSQFMQALKTDAQSLQSPTNAIRKVYNGFVSKRLQYWHLINPTEYRRAISVENWEKMEIADYDYWSKKISVWKGYVKVNIQQFIANSFLTSGPTFDPTETNSEKQNLLYLLWYNLAKDESIPYQSYDRTFEAERQFNQKYWHPFIDYTGTDFGDNVATYETDAPLEGLFNLVAELDKNKTDVQKNLVTLSKLIDLVHGRGSLSHLFIKN